MIESCNTLATSSIINYLFGPYVSEDCIYRWPFYDLCIIHFHDCSHDGAGRHPVVHDLVHEEGRLHGDDPLARHVLLPAVTSPPPLKDVVKILNKHPSHCWSYFGSHNHIPSSGDVWAAWHGGGGINIEEECSHPLTIHSLQWQRQEGSCDVRMVLVLSAWR